MGVVFHCLFAFLLPTRFDLRVFVDFCRRPNWISFTYRGCQIYADSGTVTIICNSDEGESSEMKPFATAMAPVVVQSRST